MSYDLFINALVIQEYCCSFKMYLLFKISPPLPSQPSNIVCKTTPAQHRVYLKANAGIKINLSSDGARRRWRVVGEIDWSTLLGPDVYLNHVFKREDM